MIKEENNTHDNKQEYVVINGIEMAISPRILRCDGHPKNNLNCKYKKYGVTNVT